DVAFLVAHFRVRAAIDDRVPPIQAFPAIALEGDQGDGAELDVFDDLPGFRFPLVQAYCAKTGLLEGPNEFPFFEGTRDAAAPQRGVIFEMPGYGFVGDDVGYGNPTAGFEHAENFSHQL